MPASLIGKTVDKYRIVSLLGEGGMGAVYVAEHQTIGRQVALKVLHADLAAQPDIVERFLNEARATNQIHHPAIVDIYDCDQDSQVGAYLVMELLEGHDLGRFCEPTGLLPVADAVDLVTQVGGALAAAHRCQIVHRDLKPANIFVVSDPDHPSKRRVKVLDFGIAKLIGGAGPQTRTGSLIGTPTYMSPEQCHGAKTVDHQTDIYALGAITYELLCGRPPFVAEGYGALISMHLHDPPPPPRRLVPSIPEPLEQAVLQALAKSPQGRYRSMDALVNALNHAIGNSVPVASEASVPPTRLAVPPTMLSGDAARREAAAQPVSTIPRSKSSSSRSIVVIVAAAAVVAAGVAAVYGLLSDGKSVKSPDPPRVVASGHDAGNAPDGKLATSQRSTGEQQATPGSVGPATGPCTTSWKPAAAAPKLVRTGVHRSSKMIVGFNIDAVINGVSLKGRGGRSANLARQLRGCSDSPGGRGFARVGKAVTDPQSGLRVEIVKVEPAGRTGRGWPGVRCSYRITDSANKSLHATLGGDDVPAFNELKGLVRQGDKVFASLQFNGYAREVGGKGNRVVGVDLCTHEVIWRSKDMVANGEILPHGDHLLTTYGFTAEPDWIYVLDAGTGKVQDRSRLPKAADALRLAGNKLYVQIYDGYLTFDLVERARR